MAKLTPRPAKRRPREVSQFGRRLSTLMAEQKLTVREAAAAAEVGASTIVSWRGGALPEDYRAVKSLAKRLGVSFSYLLTGEDESRPDGALVSEVFDEDGAIFDGYAHIRVIKLVPKRKDKK